MVLGLVVGLVLSAGLNALVLWIVLKRLLPPPLPGGSDLPVEDILDLIEEVAKAEVNRDELKDWLAAVIDDAKSENHLHGDDG